MKATDFEFRYRALLIGLIFCAGFWLYAADHVALVQVLVQSSLRPPALRPALAAKLILGVAALLVAIGAMVRTWGAAYLKSSVVLDSKLHTDALVADGPYRYVRHPLYSASIVATFGIALLTSRVGFAFIVIAMTLLYVRMAGREEAELERSQGQTFREFCRRVPKLLPSMWPRVPSTGAEPKWGQAFRGEMFMWGFAGAIALFAATLNLKLLWWMVTLAFLIFWALQFIHNRRKKQTSAAA
ncbi:MAG: isoprenylcysteine carboxylmethyltransferase family protein [Acidobacteriota bacterium]|nr:isoprenylcysteine carboxylmethyltransferase family protein [Acidobacteriota bacterium]